MHKNRNIIISVVIILAIVFGAYYVYNTKKHNSENAKSTQSTNVEVNKSQKEDKSTNTNKNTNSENNMNTDEPETKNTENTEKASDTVKDTKDNKIETNNKITQDRAVQLVEQSLKQKNANTKVIFDHDITRDNVEYYVIHSFDDMKDHIATSGWYYVDKSNGKVYEWDLANDKLNAIN
ncbi:hypothetical protein KM803_12865 [Clostridium tyrobutyricum]|uniref:hypothetical protein n=1 Tax=Clostridium tyrobutyricum TaxID=1519 RepID=UPI001C38A2E3|nr:hypothetical protein [Clostridium tyrobutyricum]